MKIEYSPTFAKDLARIRHPKMLARIGAAIDELKYADELADLRQIKRLQGARAFYRIRVGDFRIGFEIISGAARLLRCLDRKEMYRKFP